MIDSYSIFHGKLASSFMHKANHTVIQYDWTCPKLLLILEGKKVPNAYPTDKGSGELCLDLAEASHTTYIELYSIFHLLNVFAIIFSIFEKYMRIFILIL